MAEINSYKELVEEQLRLLGQIRQQEEKLETTFKKSLSFNAVKKEVLSKVFSTESSTSNVLFPLLKKGAKFLFKSFIK